jgi:hypothetical protein
MHRETNGGRRGLVDGWNRKQSQGIKVRGDVLTTDPQTNFPIFGAMGFEVTQGLIIGKNTLLVERPSDILHLQAVSSVLRKQKRAFLDPKFGNTIDHSNVLFKTYNPVDLEKVRQADAARLEGRRRKNKG